MYTHKVIHVYFQATTTTTTSFGFHQQDSSTKCISIQSPCPLQEVGSFPQGPTKVGSSIPTSATILNPQTYHKSFTIASFKSPAIKPAPIQADLTIIEDDQDVTLLSSHEKPKGQTILIDSREISGAQDLVSELRFKHGLNTAVRQLPACDYIVSNRMGIERKIVSDFTNGSNRVKLIDRMRHLSQIFERPILIIEKDRVKPGEKEIKQPLLKNKYVEATLAALAQTLVRLFYTETQKDTAVIIAGLAELEKRKGMVISVKVDLNLEQEQMLKFYLTLPQISYITALNLMHGFRNIGEFLRSTVSVIAKKGKILEAKAKEIYVFVRHGFDLQMLSSNT